MGTMTRMARTTARTTTKTTTRMARTTTAKTRTTTKTAKIMTRTMTKITTRMARTKTTTKTMTKITTKIHLTHLAVVLISGASLAKNKLLEDNFKSINFQQSTRKSENVNTAHINHFCKIVFSNVFFLNKR